MVKVYHSYYTIWNISRAKICQFYSYIHYFHNIWPSSVRKPPVWGKKAHPCLSHLCPLWSASTWRPYHLLHLPLCLQTSHQRACQLSWASLNQVRHRRPPLATPTSSSWQEKGFVCLCLSCLAFLLLNLRLCCSAAGRYPSGLRHWRHWWEWKGAR